MRDSVDEIVDKVTVGQPSGKSGSSPSPKYQLGLNEEMVHGGVKLHVQTEDLGIKKSKILTIVFRGGEVFFSKSTEYGHLRKDDTFRGAVMERVTFQHRTVIEEIKNGLLGDNISV